jgi:excisionase family DNA binding protein
MSRIGTRGALDLNQKGPVTVQRINHNRTGHPALETQPLEGIFATCAPISVRIPTAVRMTGIGRSKLYELIQEGAIDVVKIGSATLIPVDSLQRLIERNRK